MFLPAGSDLSLRTRNAATNKFDLTWITSGKGKGNPVFDDTQSHRCASLLIEHRARWILDTDGNRGSRLYTLRDLRRSTPSQAEAMASEAMQKAVDEHFISAVVAKARVPTRGQLRLDVTYRTKDQQQQKLGLSLHT